MEKEYTKPEFRVVSLVSSSGIAADGASSNPSSPEEDKEQGFLPWVPIK